jgi:hypothetical protein
MADPRSSTSGPRGATGKRLASGAAKPPAKSVPAAKGIIRDKAPALSYITVYRATPLERIYMVRRGIPASEAKRIFADLPRR